MSLHPTEFCLPESGDEVVGLLERYGDGALILAGGTFIHTLDARGLLADVQALIDLQKLGLGTIETGADGLRIGATATCAALARTPAVRDEPWLGAVHDAIAFMPAQIENAATVGGCIATACALFDLPVALTALDATVAARGAAGTRWIELSDVVTGMFESSLDRAEFLEQVHVPQPAARTASAFTKLETNANDLAIVNAAVRITLDENGTFAEARVVLGGGVGATLVRSVQAENVLRGAKPVDAALRAAGDAASAEVRPLSDHRASGAYRKTVAGVLVRRALERALTRTV